jgi:glycerol-3-phosphate dehydrogenase (NAD(P)+)
MHKFIAVNKIAVIGSGAWGIALAKLYSAKFEVTVFTRDISKALPNEHIKFSSSLNDIIDSDVVFIVVPAHAVRAFCASIVGLFKRDAIFILCSKGIENDSNYLMSEVAHELLPTNAIAALSGPNFANEIIQNMPAVSSIACEDATVANYLARELSIPNFNLYPTHDILGVQICGALKNVLAIMCGIADGLKLGENFKAALLTKGIKEIAQLVQAKGGDLNTIFEPGGIGDIFLTCNSKQSRNTCMGVTIAHNGGFDPDAKLDQNVEGVYTVKPLYQISKKLNLTLPVFDLAYRIIVEQKPINEQIIKNII